MSGKWMEEAADNREEVHVRTRSGMALQQKCFDTMSVHHVLAR